MSEIEWRTLARAPHYRISSDGQIIHRDATAPRKWNVLGRYPTVNFRADGREVNRTVHGLVAETFIGPRPDGMQVRHLDGNPLNNDVSNLCYGTPKDNAADKERHQRTRRGQGNGNAVLSDDAVERLRAAYRAGGYNQYELAEQFSISQAQVSNIILGKQRKRRSFHEQYERYQQPAERTTA